MRRKREGGDAHATAAPGPPAGLPALGTQAPATTDRLEKEEREEEGATRAGRMPGVGRTWTGWGMEGRLTGAVRTLVAGIGSMWDAVTGKRGRSAAQETDNTTTIKRPRVGDGY